MRQNMAFVDCVFLYFYRHSSSVIRIHHEVSNQHNSKTNCKALFRGRHCKQYNISSYLKWVLDVDMTMHLYITRSEDVK